MGQRVVHFEITADDAKRAADFYDEVLGWRFDTWGGPEAYLLASTGDPAEPGIDGAVMPRSDLVSQAVVVTAQVEDFDATAEAVRRAGGQVLQDKHAIPGIGWFSYCRDTEGNVFGIMQADPSAV